MPHRRQQRGGPPAVFQLPDPERLGRDPEPGQLGHLHRRHRAAERFFFLDEAALAEVQTRRGLRNKLGWSVQWGTVRMLGRQLLDERPHRGSSGVGSATNRPYRPTCSPDNHSCDTNRHRRRTTRHYLPVCPNRDRLVPATTPAPSLTSGSGLIEKSRPDMTTTPTWWRRRAQRAPARQGAACRPPRSRRGARRPARLWHGSPMPVDAIPRSPVPASEPAPGRTIRRAEGVPLSTPGMGDRLGVKVPWRKRWC